MYPSSQKGYPSGPGYQSGYQQQGYPNYQSYPQSTNYNQGPTVNMHLGSGNNNTGPNLGWSEPVGPFVEKSIRNAFISKVYAILSIQLAFTSVLIGIFVLNDDIKATFGSRQGQLWGFLGMIIFIVSFFILTCIESSRRSYPLNFILLSCLTVGYGLVAAIASCKYNTNIVLFAFIATALSTILITMMAKSTKFDLTTCGQTLCLLALAHCLIGMVLLIVSIAFGYSKILHVIFAVMGAFLVSLYLMYDTQLIMGGRECELSPEEYILGAIMLYIDIVQLFLYLLQIFNYISDD